MKVVLYTRVSTEDQSCESQLAELRKYALHRGWQVVGEYVDQVTGDVKKRVKKNQRFRYDELMEDAEKGAFDAVLVWKFDRFARSVVHLVSALEKFQSLSVDFISVTQNIDTTTPAGRLFFHMIAAIAEFERHLISERVRAGLKLIKETGKNSKGEAVRLGAEEKVTPEQKEGILSAWERGVPVRTIASTVDMPFPTVYSIIKRCMVPCTHGKYRCKPCGGSHRVQIRPDAATAPCDVEGNSRSLHGNERVRAQKAPARRM